MISATARLALGCTLMLALWFVRVGLLRRDAVLRALERQIHSTEAER